jgi:hypothetical protein
MRRTFIAVAGVAVTIVIGYLALWAYANQDNSIRCHEQSSTPAHIGLTEFSCVWGYFGSSATHCVPTARKK